MFEPLADLDRHATERPGSIAIAGPRRSYSFAQLRDATLAVAARLSAAGIVADDTVAVDLPVALEWIIDLALFRLAARSVSIRGVSDTTALRLDALLTHPGSRAALAPLVVEIDELWIDSAVASAPEPPPLVPFGSDDSIFRLMLTSGTTGSPRPAAYSVGAFRYRRGEGHLHWTDARPELTLIGLSTTGGFHAAAACLQFGVPYLAVDGINAEALRFAAAQSVEVLCGSPLQMAQVMRVMAEAAVSIPSLTEVRLAGAGPSDELLELIVDTFHVPVRGVYGSTEGGGVSQLMLRAGDRYNVGLPLPDVELEVVDADGLAVPTGVEGIVRYRTPGLVSGYLADDVVVPFADGWFVPGDLGTLLPDGSLVLAGRDSEVLNLGGVKLDPLRVDEAALGFAGVRDAAAFSLERVPGFPEVGLAVVTDEGCDLRQLDRELRAKLPLGHPTAFWRVTEIPRSRLGKAQRGMLAEGFTRASAQRAND